MDTPVRPGRDVKMLRLRSISRDKSLVKIDFGNERKETKTHGSTLQNTISPIWFILFLIIGIVLYFLIHLAQYTLPTPLTLEDVRDYPEEFNSERAIEHLRMLTSFGPRVVGTYANEKLTVHYLKSQLEMIGKSNIAVDVQMGTGCYYLEFRPYEFSNCYTNIQNIVARLKSPNRESNKALLLNCHFDSVPTSPGASDDGINCAIMLEIIYILATRSVPLKHDVVFLFNGAEETPLQASHLFISQHPWAKDIGAFINLEACGAGGREILFQTGPNNPWLVKAYASSVYRPFGVVAGEEIFQSGLIPSDTDFRVFRDFGKIPGLDFAFAMNGYIYHTNYDSMEYIPNGTYQHAGDNILALTKALANAPQLDNPTQDAEGHMVYFDIFGLFMVSYSETIGFVLNSIWIVVSLISVFLFLRTLDGKWTSRLCSLTLAIAIQLVSWVLALLLCLLIAVIVDAAGKSLSWYTRNWFLFPLYYMPTIAIISMFSTLPKQLNKKKKDLQDWTEYARYQSVAQQIIWTVGLLLLTALQIRSAFIIAMIVWLPSIILIVLSLLKIKGLRWLFGYCLSYIFAVVYIMSTTVLIFGLFIPISGRSGPFQNPDLMVSLISGFLAIYTCAFLCPLAMVVRHRRIIFAVLTGFVVLFLILVLATPISFPYAASKSGPSPQRVQIMHFDREVYNKKGELTNSTSGLWLMPQDRIFPKSLYEVPEVANAKPTGSWCELYLGCGLPIFGGRQIPFAEQSHWIERPKPVFHMPISIQLVNRTSQASNKHRFEFSVYGPEYMLLIISPKEGVKLSNWSFPTTVKPSGATWRNQSIHFVHHVVGTWTENWNFSIDLEAESTKNEMLDIALSGNYKTQEHSSELKEFSSTFPEWTHIVAFKSSYRSWIF